MKTLTTLACLATLAVASSAHAQQGTQPPLPFVGKWDAAGQLALLNRNKSDLSSWDQWYSAAAVNGSAGYYWTPHFKTEFEIGTAGAGTIDGDEAIPVPGSTFPFPRYRDHRLNETTFGGAAIFQFFDNQWIHPFIGAGAELVREHHVADALPAQTIRFSTAVPMLQLPAVPAIDSVTYAARPLVTGGAKFYIAPRAFLRTEVRTAFSTTRPLAIEWRGGVGFDF